MCGISKHVVKGTIINRDHYNAFFWECCSATSVWDFWKVVSKKNYFITASTLIYLNHILGLMLCRTVALKSLLFHSFLLPIALIIRLTHVLANMVFNELLVILNKISWSLHCWLWKLIKNLGLLNTTFNEFLIISNKNISFLLKFYHGFSKQYHILSFKVYLKLPDACNSSKFEFKIFSFKCVVVSNCIVVTLQLYVVKNSEFKEDEIIAFWKI